MRCQQQCRHAPFPGQFAWRRRARGQAGKEGLPSSLLRFGSPQQGAQAGASQEEEEEARAVQEGVEAGLSQGREAAGLPQEGEAAAGLSREGEAAAGAFPEGVAAARVLQEGVKGGSPREWQAAGAPRE